MRKLLVAALALTLMLLGSTGLASFKVKIYSSSAKVYQTPSVSAAHIDGVAGVTLKCTATSGDWARVSYKNRTAYMKIADLNLTNRVKAYAKSSTPVYNKASASTKLGTLATGSVVYAVGYQNGYVRVENKSGSATGYVKASQLSKKAVKAIPGEVSTAGSSSVKSSSAKSSSAKSSSGKSSSKLTTLINTAKAQIGKPYGYSAPSSFNCSSLVRYCYRKVGYSMKSTAAKQAADDRLTKISSISKLKPGDVICFDTDGDGTCDHVGLFVSGSTYIEASHGAGVVRTNKLNSYYRRVFMWARRVK